MIKKLILVSYMYLCDSLYNMVISCYNMSIKINELMQNNSAKSRKSNES